MKCKPYVLFLAAVGIASLSVQAAMVMEAATHRMATDAAPNGFMQLEIELTE